MMIHKQFQHAYLVPLLACLALAMSGQTLAARAIGKVMVVSGSVQAQLPGQGKRTLARHAVIYLHDTLITNATGHAQIRLRDGALLTLNPSTVYRIDEYRYQQTGVGDAYEASLIQGGANILTGEIKRVCHITD